MSDGQEHSVSPETLAQALSPLGENRCESGTRSTTGSDAGSNTGSDTDNTLTCNTSSEASFAGEDIVEGEPFPEHERLQWAAIFEAMMLNYARRNKMVKQSLGYPFPPELLKDVILEYAGVLWESLELNDIGDLRAKLEATIQDGCKPYAAAIKDTRLRAAVAIDLPDAKSVATGSWNNSHQIHSLLEDTDGFPDLRDKFCEDYQELYQGSKEEYEHWFALKKRENPEFMVQDNTLYPPVVEQARTIWEQFNVVSIEEIRHHLSRTVLPEDMEAYVNNIDDEELRGAMIERQKWAFKKGRGIDWF